MTNGILLALIAYATFSWGDAGIKSLRGQLSIFEIGLYVTISAGFFILLSRPRDERWAEFWRMKRPHLVVARALTGNLAGLLGIFAFTTIPLAEAYALVFLAPLFVTILSIIFLKEQVGIWRWAAIVAGFMGVLLVVRPGFKALEPGHFAAAGIAVMTALTIVLLRTLSGTEKRTSILGMMLVVGLIFNGVGVAVTGLTLPGWHQAAVFAMIGALGAIGQNLLLTAARLAPANYIAPTQYSQIAWAAVIGALFFNEYPDAISIVGLVVVACSGLLTLLREQIRLGKVRWKPFRTRL